MRYPKILFVYCDENDDCDCNRQETWTGEVKYILKSEYDQLKAENERLQQHVQELDARISAYEADDPYLAIRYQAQKEE